MKTKTLIIIGLVSILTFPIVALSVMFFTGFLKLEIATDKKPKAEKVAVAKHTRYKDSL